MSRVSAKLTAARTRLIMERPFLGALAMHLPLVRATGKWCPTTATDAKAVYYNPAFIDRISLAQVQFMLAHEVMHCALCHFARRNGRDLLRWNVACDYVINGMLLEEGMSPAPGALHRAEYTRLSAEQVYPKIEANAPLQTVDRHLYDPNAPESGEWSPVAADANSAAGGVASAEGGSVQDDAEAAPEIQETMPEPLGGAEKEALETVWRQRAAAAAQRARDRGAGAGVLVRAVEESGGAALPWHHLLAQYLNRLGRDDYSFNRASRRRHGDVILPGLHSRSVDLVVALDTSGSIRDAEFAEFLAELNGIKAQLNARVLVHACDDRLDPAGPWRYEPWEPLRMPDTVRGGGGTDFTPAFLWNEKHRLRPDAMLYFTDARGVFPGAPPEYPVLWVVKGEAAVPWGLRVPLSGRANGGGAAGGGLLFG